MELLHGRRRFTHFLSALHQLCLSCILAIFVGPALYLPVLCFISLSFPLSDFPCFLSVLFIHYLCNLHRYLSVLAITYLTIPPIFLSVLLIMSSSFHCLFFLSTIYLFSHFLSVLPIIYFSPLSVCLPVIYCFLSLSVCLAQ
jgi:hypothetical protein